MNEFERDCWESDRKWWRYEWRRRKAAEQRYADLLDLLRRVVSEAGAVGNLVATREARNFLAEIEYGRRLDDMRG